MDVLGGVRDALQQVTDRVVGAPVERDGATVVPVVAVRAGGGGGSGSGGPDGQQVGEGTGGGWGAVARPVGAYVIRDGDVRYEPALDVTRMVVGAQVLAAVVVLVVGRVLRRRRRR